MEGQDEKENNGKAECSYDEIGDQKTSKENGDVMRTIVLWERQRTDIASILKFTVIICRNEISPRPSTVNDIMPE